jgi:hypothetical protein
MYYARASHERSECVSILVHRENRGPMRGVIAEPESAVDRADCVGKRPAARDDQRLPKVRDFDPRAEG